MKDGNSAKQNSRIAFFGVRSWNRETIEREIINLDTVGVGIFEVEIQDDLELANRYEIISVSSHANLNKTTLDKLPNLRMIASRSTGLDHIDLEECKKRKIEVRNVPVYGEHSVAEYAIALMLAVAKKIIPAHQSVEDGEFTPAGLTGIDIFGKTLGVVGVGTIGKQVVKIAKAMGMKVIAVDKGDDLEDCLKKVDVLTLHVPADESTYHLINKKNIKLMRPGSILINTCRGAVVESEAIVWALNNKILLGAGLDVVEEEEKLECVSMVMSQRPSKDDLQKVLSFHLLRDRDDVVFTPHNAFNTKEAIERVVRTTIDNINGFGKN